MSTRTEKPGIHDCCLVKRRLKLNVPDTSTMESIRAALDRLPTVDHVAIGGNGRRLDVAYDASTDDLDHMLEVVREHGGELSTDRWTRFRADGYRFTDQNVKDNRRQEAASCHSAPPVRLARHDR